MKQLGWVCMALLLFLLAVFTVLGSTPQVSAQTLPPDDVTLGGLLYDNWMAALGIEPPSGSHPIWGRQSNNTHSGTDTWRCVSCHGWDYQGKDGAYRSGSFYTGFPGLMPDGKPLDETAILAALQGTQDPEHNFSQYLTEPQLKALAVFLSTAAIDDTKYIDPIQRKVIKGGDIAHGQALYDQACSTCHGKEGLSNLTVEGEERTLNFNGMAASLGTIAVQDPWRFLHKTRFGTPGSPMVIGYELGWTAQDGRDVLLYVQSLPDAQAMTAGQPGTSPSPADVGGPTKSLGGGILTAFAAMATTTVFALLLGAALVAIIFLIVWALRARK